MAYKVELFGEEVPLSHADFVKINTNLSVRYAAERDPEKRRGLVDVLFRLNKPLFKSWQVWDADDRAEFDREAFLYVHRALETYRPERGAFVSWLKLYVLQARTDYATGKRQHRAAMEGAAQVAEEGPTPEPEADPLFWQGLRGHLSAPEWRLLSLRVLSGKTIPEVAATLEVDPLTVSRRLASLFDKIRLYLAGTGESRQKSANPGLHNGYSANSQQSRGQGFDGARWVTRAELGERLGLSPWYVSALLSNGLKARACPYVIDPRDVVRLQGTRIRYLEDSRGLVYPRLAKRPKGAGVPEGIPGKGRGGGTVAGGGALTPALTEFSKLDHNGAKGIWFPPPLEPGKRPRGRPRKNPLPPSGEGG